MVGGGRARLAARGGDEAEVVEVAEGVLVRQHLGTRRVRLVRGEGRGVSD